MGVFKITTIEAKKHVGNFFPQNIQTLIGWKFCLYILQSSLLTHRLKVIHREEYFFFNLDVSDDSS